MQRPARNCGEAKENELEHSLWTLAQVGTEPWNHSA
jgi:hypothetical protein